MGNPSRGIPQKRYRVPVVDTVLPPPDFIYRLTESRVQRVSIDILAQTFRIFFASSLLSFSHRNEYCVQRIAFVKLLCTRFRIGVKSRGTFVAKHASQTFHFCLAKGMKIEADSILEISQRPYSLGKGTVAVLLVELFLLPDIYNATRTQRNSILFPGLLLSVNPVDHYHRNYRPIKTARTHSASSRRIIHRRIGLS